MCKVRSQSYVAGEKGRRVVAREMEKVFDVSLVHFDFEIDVVADGMERIPVSLRKCAYHLPARRDVGMAQDGIHGIETRIAVGAIHDGMELSFQIHRGCRSESG